MSTWIECPFCFVQHTIEVWASESEDCEGYFCMCGAVFYGGMPNEDV